MCRGRHKLTVAGRALVEPHPRFSHFGEIRSQISEIATVFATVEWTLSAWRK